MKTPAHSGLRRRQEISALTGRLRQQDRRITAPRQAILEVLRHESHPLSNGEIFKALPKGGCDLATVYRCTRMLTNAGMAKRFDFGDGVARYELLRAGDDGHHHHLVCIRCAGVVEVDECCMSELEQRLAARNGFTAVTHRLEFFGICPACQESVSSRR